jgi:phosphopantothenoylcysteine decarboxylase/phosphopantothenate--cysteine ligase
MVGPDAGWLAEGESGWGRMAEPDEIVRATLAVARRSRQLDGRTVLITAGPTREPVDPVRYIGNRSSGRMGYALATAARRRGARVVLISGPVSLAPPWGVELERVETAGEMREAVLAARSGADAVFMVAAVADYAPVPAAAKIKKSEATMTLTLERGRDILRELGESKGDTLLIGFAAESEDLLPNARKKLEAKNLDFIVANDISRPDRGMGSDHNAVTILDRDGGAVEVPRALKGQVAECILDRVFGEAAET